MSVSKHWAMIEEVGSAKGMWFLLHTYKLFGRIPFQCVLYPVVVYFYFRNPIARTSIREYYLLLKNYFVGVENIQAISVNLVTILKHYLSFAEAILDKILSNTGGYQLESVSSINREVVLKYLEQKKGLLILTAHIGNLELCRAVAQLRNIKINVLIHTANSQQFNRMMRYVVDNPYISFIEVSSIGPTEALILSQKVSLGEVVVIAADRIPLQNIETHTVQANFLGKKALFPIGPYVLAHILQCPVVSMFCVRLTKDYQVGFLDFANCVELPRHQRQELAAQYAQKFADHMELYCKIAPNQWFNFYPFWQND